MFGYKILYNFLSIILILSATISKTMMFAKKCPKCGGEIQTKSIRKAIGLGFVQIPVAQFCLNPECNWFQDFSEAKEPDEIKENVLQVKVPSIIPGIPEMKRPDIPRKHFIVMGGIIAVVAIILLLNSIARPSQPQSSGPEVTPGITPVVTASTAPQATTQAPVMTPVRETGKYSIKMDVTHGFNPAIMSINQSDIVIWNDDENQRTRVVLISKEGLFENQHMEYSDKFQYKFDQSGKYTFALAEYPSLNEYPDAVGQVIVK